MDNSTDNAQIHIARLGEIKIEEYSATEAFRNFTLPSPDFIYLLTVGLARSVSLRECRPTQKNCECEFSEHIALAANPPRC